MIMPPKTVKELEASPVLEATRGRRGEGVCRVCSALSALSESLLCQGARTSLPSTPRASTKKGSDGGDTVRD